MSITFQKIAGAVLFALILVVGVRMLGDLLVPLPKPAETEVAEAEGEAAPAQAAAGGAAPQAAANGGDQPLPVLLAGANPEQGQAAARKCRACHTFDEGGKHGVGPNLHGVVGQDIAAQPGYTYSNALQKVEGSWTYEMLDQFIARPGAAVPGTKMSFAGVPSPKERADIIGYLRSVSPAAPPLPEAGAETSEGPAGQPAQQPPAAAE